jgi:hypothetical protein
MRERRTSLRVPAASACFAAALLAFLPAGSRLPTGFASACDSPGNYDDGERRRAEVENAEALVFPGRDPHSRSASRDPAETGSWRELAADTQVLAVSAALLPTGDVLVMAGSGNDHSYRRGISEVRLFDPETETILGAPEFPGAHVPAGAPATLHDNDIFCAGHSFLADGRLLVAGGNLEYPTGWVHREPGVTADLDHTPADFDHPLPYDNPEIERPACHGFLGLRDSFLFDPATLTWSRAGKMARGRWYPSTLALADGRVLAINGFDDVGDDGCRAIGNTTVETFESMDVWSEPVGNPAGWPDERYPYVHLLPTGEAFYAGPNARSFVFDATTLARIGETMPSKRGYRDNGGSVLLALLPEEGYRARVMNFGGSVLFGTIGHPTAEIIDLSEPAPEWRLLQTMHHGRMHVPSVLLPDGTLLVVGGSAVSETVGEGVLEAEIFDPASETWSLASAASIERHYHSVAVLLPDARVWVAGSNPDRPDDGEPDTWVVWGDDCTPGVPCHPDPWDAHGYDELRMEIYSPPYLHRGARPEIASAPEVLRYGESFDVELASETAAESIARAVLVRPASTTHARSFDQRVVGLVRTTGPASGGGDVLSLVAPPTSALAPPGYYMLFVLDDDGVPSVARFVRLDGSTTPCTAGQDLEGDDLDADGAPDACDTADAPLALRRVTVRAGDGARSGRLRVRAETTTASDGRRLDAGAGLALRVADAGAFDFRAELTAAECETCGTGCWSCENEARTVRVKSKRLASGRDRVTIRASGVTAVLPASAMTAVLTDGVAIYQQGIDWAGAAAECSPRGSSLVCRTR